MDSFEGFVTIYQRDTTLSGILSLVLESFKNVFMKGKFTHRRSKFFPFSRSKFFPFRVVPSEEGGKCLFLCCSYFP